MVCKIKAFGIASDILGGKNITLTISGKTVGDLRRHLSLHYPKIDGLRSLFVAVNQTYREDGDELTEGDEIAVIPPVSGG